MLTARTGDIVTHYADSGEGSRPTIVFVNSLGTDHRVWDALIRRLDGGHRLVRYDMRGHGLSGLTQGPYTFELLADDLAALLDHLRLGPVILCGLSIGGMVAQQLAASRPARIRALILMDTAARIADAATWQQRIDLVEEQGVEALADGVLERWFPPDFHDKRANELALWRNMLTRTPAAGYAACCGALRDGDLTERSARLSLPTLCLGGTEDGSTPPEVVNGLAELIDGARFEPIEGAGHLPCVDAPDEVARHIGRFLSELGDAG